MNFLNVADVYIERIKQTYNLIKEELPNSEVYLFGSYAKRKIKATSDLDMLVLVDNGRDKKELKHLKWGIEEKLEMMNAFEYEVDLKVYTREHFDEKRKERGFEFEIDQYMIKLEEELWR